VCRAGATAPRRKDPGLRPLFRWAWKPGSSFAGSWGDGPRARKSGRGTPAVHFRVGTRTSGTRSRIRPLAAPARTDRARASDFRASVAMSVLPWNCPQARGRRSRRHHGPRVSTSTPRWRYGLWYGFAQLPGSGTTWSSVASSTCWWVTLPSMPLVETRLREGPICERRVVAPP